MSKNSHRRIYRNCVATRACNILARALRERALSATCDDDAYMTRSELESLMLDSRYASTVHKTIAYCDDIRTYHGGILSYVKVNRFITHVRLVNAFAFNVDGFRKSVAEMQQDLIDAAKAASESSDDTAIIIDADNVEVLNNETLLLTYDSNEESVTIDADNVEVLNNETLLLSYDNKTESQNAVSEESFAEKMKRAKAAKKAAREAA